VTEKTRFDLPDASLSLSEVIAFTRREKVAVIAQKLLNGNISVIEAARQIGACRGKSGGLDETDPDFVTFLAIDTATDHQLFVESLQNWARPYALARKDAVVARCETLVEIMRSAEKFCAIVESVSKNVSPEREPGQLHAKLGFCRTELFHLQQLHDQATHEKICASRKSSLDIAARI
jgi:hypothetical protein